MPDLAHLSDYPEAVRAPAPLRLEQRRSPPAPRVPPAALSHPPPTPPTPAP